MSVTITIEKCREVHQLHETLRDRGIQGLYTSEVTHSVIKPSGMVNIEVTEQRYLQTSVEERRPYLDYQKYYLEHKSHERKGNSSQQRDN